jgi:uncharacterized membrane protein YdjX (TVP38/TMEM64 family)
MYARLFGKGLLHKHLGDRARRFDAFIHDHPFSMTLLIRLLPVGSNVLTNLAAGISSIRPASFLSASFIGYLPQTLVFALVGSGIDLASTFKLGIAVALFLCSGILGAYLYHQHRHGLSIDESVDAALGESQQP